MYAGKGWLKKLMDMEAPSDGFLSKYFPTLPMLLTEKNAHLQTLLTRLHIDQMWINKHSEILGSWCWRSNIATNINQYQEE